MSFSFFLQLLINGFIAGSIYSLIALGFSLIYTTNKFMNFAYGSVVVLCAFLGYLFSVILQINFIISIFLAVVYSGLLGFLLAKLLFFSLREKKASNTSMLIVSIAILIIIESLLLMIFGAGVKSFPILNFLFDVQNSIVIFGAILTWIEIIIILFSLSLLVIVYLVLMKTGIGIKMRAISDNPILCESIGISVKSLMLLAFIVAFALGGIAGILVGLEYTIEPSMGTGLMIKGFSGAVIGGVTSGVGSIVGAFIVGIAENLGAGIFPTQFKDAIAYTLLFIFLIFKPEGLFASKSGEHD